MVSLGVFPVLSVWWRNLQTVEKSSGGGEVVMDLFGFGSFCLSSLVE